MPEALILEDDVPSREALEVLVTRSGFRVRAFGTLAEARQSLETWTPSLAILDLDLPDGQGTELIDQLQDDGAHETEIVFVTGNASVESAVTALRGGAIDYLTKPVDTRRLRRLLARVSRETILRHEVRALRSQLKAMGRFGPVVGGSAAMLALYDKIERVAPTSATVTIIGETGVGKELVARAVHEISPRKRRPFIAVNCGALPANLVEAELFGHEKGAFTGADKRREGVFERAAEGTLFLDEITEMPIESQAKLLRVLENRQITRVGGSEVISISTRIVAATNRDPMKAVKDGRLREDLLHRLLVFPILVPPLREREGDLRLLAAAFLEELNAEAGTEKTYAADTLAHLESRTWPGNVRQLRNVVERGFIMADSEIRPSDLLDAETEPKLTVPEALPLEVGMSIAQAEQKLIEATLERLDGDKKEAANVLGISLKTLYNRLSTYRGPE